MITLFTAKPHFGLPDPSPFVCKAMVLLKMAGLQYVEKEMSFRKAPKGKVPYIEDSGRLLADSTFIRFHLETRYGADFDKGLSAGEKAIAWAFEKMVEEHLYFALIDARWTDDRDFDKGPREFFKVIPAPLRPFIIRMVRGKLKKALHAQGMGRHRRDEIIELARRDLEAVSNQLDDSPWLMGAEPCGADASAWSQVTGALCPHFDGPLRAAAEAFPNLVAYRDRGMKRWFPELVA
jgi:glutathione S-transferase